MKILLSSIFIHTQAAENQVSGQNHIKHLSLWPCSLAGHLNKFASCTDSI